MKINQPKFVGIWWAVCDTKGNIAVNGCVCVCMCAGEKSNPKFIIPVATRTQISSQ